MGSLQKIDKADTVVVFFFHLHFSNLVKASCLYYPKSLAGGSSFKESFKVKSVKVRTSRA